MSSYAKAGWHPFKAKSTEANIIDYFFLFLEHPVFHIAVMLQWHLIQDYYNFNFSKFSIINVSVFSEKATFIKNIMANKKLYLTKLIKFDLTYYWVK